MRRSVLASLCTLALLLAAPAGLQAQSVPQALAPESAPAEKPADAEPALPASPSDRVHAVLAKLARCRQPNQLLEPRCALVIYHEASVILREEDVKQGEEPVLWWTVFQGTGTSMAQLGQFEKAMLSFQAAGGVFQAPREAREESAYFLGRVQHELGMIDEAIHTYDVLFIQNNYWVDYAERDPLLASLRRTKKWEDMIQHHIKEEGDTGSVPEPSVDPAELLKKLAPPE